MVKRTIRSIKSILTREQNEIISAASILMLLTLVSKLSGLLLQTLIARQFGANKQYDIFLLSSVIPETITNIILIGAVSGSIIPVFVKVKEKKGDAQFLKSFSATINLSILAFIILSTIAGIFAKQLVPLAINLTNSHSNITDADISQIIWMMRVLLVPQILLAISAFISTSLNIYHRFIIPQLAPIFFNFGRMLGIVLFVPLLSGSIWGLVWGTVVGSAFHLIIQVPLLRHLGLNIKIGFFDLKDKYFKEAIKLGLPRIISLSAEQVASVIDSIIAFGLTVGSLSAYSYAVRLLSFPLNMFGTSFAVASFPSLAKLYARGAIDEFQRLVRKVINQIMFLTIPVAVIMLALRVPIVRLVYGILGGSFDWNDTLQVSWVLLFFTIGVSFEAMRSTFFRIYYAIHNSVIPLISSVFVMIFGAITGILFTNYFSHFHGFSLSMLSWDVSYLFSRGTGIAGAGGLSLSSSFVFTLEFFFLLFALKYTKAVKDLKPILKDLAKKFFIGLIMFLVTYSMAKMWEEVLNTAKTAQLILLTGTTSFSALMVYLWTSFVFKVEEVEFFMGFISKNLKKLKKRK